MKKAFCLALLFFPEIVLGYPRIKNPQNPNEVQINFNDVSDEIGRVQSSCLTSSSATATYLSTISAAATYLSNSSATATYLQLSSASATYLQPSVAANTYLTKSSATATYQQKTDSVSTTLITGTLPIDHGGTGSTTALMKLVTWTGDGSASRSIAHGMGATPVCGIIIRLDSTGMDVPVVWMTGSVWGRFTNGVGNATDGFLSLTATYINVGSHASVNANGATYAAMIFASQ